MAEAFIAQKKERLVSLDVFRGITIAGMVLVNNPGTWGHIYHPLGHASWDGWTPTDFIFPFFLFIVGVAMTLSFDRRLKRGDSKVRLFEQVVRRTIIIFLLGLILNGFPNFRLIMPYILVIVGLGFLFADEPPLGFFDRPMRQKIDKIVAYSLFVVAAIWFFADFVHFNGHVIGYDWKYLWPMGDEYEGARNLRVPGVLQRIAICYFVCSIIMMFGGVASRVWWTAGLLVGYWFLMKHEWLMAGYPLGGGEGQVPDAPAGAPYRGLMVDWLDVKVFGAHLYSHRPDPEGLLSTIPAIATTLTGILAGTWLHGSREKIEKCAGLFFAGGILIAIGWFWNYDFPYNKKIWSSSYVLFTSGMALYFLAFCFYLIDIKGKQAWSKPFLVFGTNAIFIFFASGILARLLYMVKWEKASGEGMWNIKSFIYEQFFAGLFGDGKAASCTYALVYVGFWLLLTYPLYRKKIFIKI